jgi:hypothetical protein
VPGPPMSYPPLLASANPSPSPRIEGSGDAVCNARQRRQAIGWMQDEAARLPEGGRGALLV